MEKGSENIPFAFIDLLEGRGFSAHHLKKIGEQGIRNGEVYGIAERENMRIITRDADFLSMRL